MKISIIIPVYNTEKYLESCLVSIFNSTFLDFEVILINDGSTDNSGEICNVFQRKYPNIVTLHKTNSGQGICRNLGIQMARGEYVLFVDSDDSINNDFLANLVTFNEIDKQDVIVTDLKKVYATKEIYFKNLIEFSRDMKINLMLSHPGSVAKLIRKEILISNNVVFEAGRIFEDLTFNVRLALAANKIMYIPKAFYNYQIREKSTTNNAQLDIKFDDIYYIVSQIDNLLTLNPKEMEYLYIEHILYSASLRFLKYTNTEQQVVKNVEIIRKKFPNWSENCYYRRKSMKFKLICHLVYKMRFKMIRFLQTLGENS